MTKHLEEGCTGSVLCEVVGHVTARQGKEGGVVKWRHKPLTSNQRKELLKKVRER